MAGIRQRRAWPEYGPSGKGSSGFNPETGAGKFMSTIIGAVSRNQLRLGRSLKALDNPVAAALHQSWRAEVEYR
jgi:hypothetical protein